MSRAIRYLLPMLAIALFCVSDIYAQSSGSYKNFPVPFGPTNAGREFWFAMPANWDVPTATRYYIRLYITSGVRTQVKVWAGPGIKRVFYTKPYDIVTIDLSPIEAQMFTRNDTDPVPEDQIYRKKAIHIEAGAPIVVYAMNRTSFTSDGILVLPVNALGRDYIVASYAAVIGVSQELPSQFMVVAPYNGTTVTINQPMQTPNHDEGEQVTIEMDSGDVYSAMTVGYGGDMSGAVISSNKPVAVIAGQNCTYIPNLINFCCCDHLSEMMLPMSSWGKFYHGISYLTRLRGDFWRVFAAQPNTTVYVNGTKYATLNGVGGDQGIGWLEYIATGPGLIEFSADKPIYVAQYNTSQAYDGVLTDPFYLVLTPLEQYQTRLTFATPADDFPANYINFVADSATFREIEMAPGGTDDWEPLWKYSGTGVPKYFPTLINGRRYLGVTIDIKPGSYQIRGPVPFAGYIYGFSQYDSYGYPLSVAVGDLSRPDTVAPEIVKEVTCDGTLKATTTDRPENPLIRTNLATIELDPDGTFNYELAVKPFEAGVSQLTNYTLYVVDRKLPARAVVVISDMAGNITLDTLIYTPFRVVIEPSLIDFGNMISGETRRMKATITNQSNEPAEIFEALLKSGKEGFTIIIPTGRFTLGPAGSGEESVEAEIEFTAKKTGIYQDSLGLRDTCGLRYLALVQASVGKPVIEVTDNDFRKVLVGTTTPIWLMRVKNITTEGGLLQVTGATGPTDGTIFKLPNGLPPFPFTLKPGEIKEIAVTFTALAEQVYNDQIVFTHNAPDDPANDPVGLLKGEGVKDKLIATDHTWPRVRINTQSYDTVVYLLNFGSAPVRVSNVSVQGHTADFTVLNENQVEGARLDPGDTQEVRVRFHPTAVGDREMRIIYEADPQQPDEVVSILKGVGVEPALATQDYDYGTMNVRDPEVSRKVHFWIPLGSLYRDTVTITGFRFRSDAANGTNDFRSVPLDTVLQLIPGVRDSVEFTGFFQAQDVNTRRAELEALTLDGVNATSNWTGRGTSRSAGIAGTGGIVNGICVGDSGFVTATINNTGDIDLIIDSLRMSSPDFTIVDPDPNTRFRMRPEDGARNVVISYVPTKKEVQTARLIVYNSTGTPLELEIIGGSVDDTLNTFVRLTGTLNGQAELGSDLIGTVAIENLPSGRDITDYSVIITYDTAQLVARTDITQMGLGDANPAGGTIKVNSFTRKGRLVLDVTLPSGLEKPGDLISVPFGVLFTMQDTRSLAATVVAAANCLTITDTNATIGVAPVCGLDLRLIELTSADYALDQNKPNPFNPVTVIRYSLGLDGPTQMYLFDGSGRMVQKLVDQHQPSGTYELTLDVTALPSGNYYYKLVSGDWSETRMLTIVK